MKPRNPEKELKVAWSKKDKELIVYYPSSPTGHMISDMIHSKTVRTGFTDDCKKRKEKILSVKDWNPNMCFYEDKSFIEELESRGYDISTLKISVRKKDEQQS